MVVSKKCKICTVLDAGNIPISGEYFGKLLPDLIEKTSGIKLDPRKSNGVLICQTCAIQLVHTDLVIDKLRNSLQRLKQLVKETKPKTPSKDSASTQAKKTGEIKNIEQQNTDKSEINSQTNLEEPKNQDEIVPKTPKKIARRKSVFSYEPQVNNEDISKQCEQAIIDIPNAKFAKILDIDATPLKKKAKRKSATSADEDLNNTTTNSIPMDDTENIETPLVKRYKTTSISAIKEPSMDLTIYEHDDSGPNNGTTINGSKEKVMNCIICGKAFHQKSALRNHIETSHMGERLKACAHCSSEFRSQQKYESHIFSEKCRNTNHTCQYPKCNKRFKTVHKMELHMQEKHSSQNDSEAK